ncbi:MAG TPA: RidA family protein [Marinobacter sp.]|nr:RidA family protein [Marinobacter sp.]
MTKIVKVKTGSAFEEKFSYSRIVAVDNWIFMSGTAGRNPKTKLIPTDITEQTHQVFANVEAALSAIDASLKDIVSVRVFIQFPEDISAVNDIVGEKFRGINPAITTTCPPLCSPEYKVELEVTAYRGASSIKAEEIMFTP